MTVGEVRPLRRRIRKTITKRLVGLLAAVLPAVYFFYMNAVWRTSRVELVGGIRFQELRRRHEGIVGALWHETVFYVAYAFREFFPSTLASRSDFGEIITRLLSRCDFVTFRGGNRKSSERPSVLTDLIDHMRRHRRVAYGITVDGSRGPRHVLKPGVVAIARACGVPIYTVHVAARPALRIPTWDRTQIPLPFGRIVVLFEGATFCPADASPEEAERIRAKVEADLVETARRADRYLATGRLPYETDDVRRGPYLLTPADQMRPVARDTPDHRGGSFSDT